MRFLGLSFVAWNFILDCKRAWLDFLSSFQRTWVQTFFLLWLINMRLVGFVLGATLKSKYLGIITIVLRVKISSLNWAYKVNSVVPFEHEWAFLVELTPWLGLWFVPDRTVIGNVIERFLLGCLCICINIKFIHEILVLFLYLNLVKLGVSKHTLLHQ